MGVPFPGADDTPPPPPVVTTDDPTSSEEESGGEGEEGDEEDEGEWFEDEDSEGEWDDPSEGGVLSAVFAAAEAGDADELATLLDSLSVSIDTPVRLGFKQQQAFPRRGPGSACPGSHRPARPPGPLAGAGQRHRPAPRGPVRPQRRCLPAARPRRRRRCA